METRYSVVILVSQHVKLPHSSRGIALNMEYAPFFTLACHQSSHLFEQAFTNKAMDRPLLSLLSPAV